MIVIGDSHTRSLQVNDHPLSRTWTFPGATVQRINEKIPEILKVTPAEAEIILCVGSNNLSCDPPNRIIHALHRSVTLLRSERPRIKISLVGLFPRLLQSHRNEDKLTIHTNLLMKQLCIDRLCNWVSLDLVICSDPTLLDHDGLHLTHRGKLALISEIRTLLSSKASENI